MKIVKNLGYSDIRYHVLPFAVASGAADDFLKGIGIGSVMGALITGVSKLVIGGLGLTSLASAGNRINAKINTALVPEWKNSRQYEAVIKVPKGTTINIGRVEKQYTKTGALIQGDGDQILLPQGCSSELIKEIREVPSR
ncbi:hypothetical protein ACQPU1_05360 [Clostridium paraputrificum]|uniref:hypothetical protein n=1 Tax=Clostridium TaxID=1485 RepID=UPI003D34EEFB